VIITHGRARRRMVTYACEVAATMARTGVPALIAESLASAATATAVTIARTETTAEHDVAVEAP
jgi:fatty acid/phospholipid biosynthesis enzyme